MNINRKTVIKRVNEWLDRVEKANPWNHDGGESLGELKLSAVHTGCSDGDGALIDIMCVEKLAEENVG